MAADREMQQIRRLLAEERAALLKGELPRLENLLKRKAPMIDALEKRPPSPKHLVEIRALLRRNQALAQSAQEGIKAVSARLAGLANGAPVGTYGADGLRQTLAAPRRTLAKRA